MNALELRNELMLTASFAKTLAQLPRAWTTPSYATNNCCSNCSHWPIGQGSPRPAGRLAPPSYRWEATPWSDDEPPPGSTIPARYHDPRHVRREDTGPGKRPRLGLADGRGQRAAIRRRIRHTCGLGQPRATLWFESVGRAELSPASFHRLWVCRASECRRSTRRSRV